MNTSPHTANSPLSINDLSVHYHGQETPALESINFDANAGHMTAIVGPNGAGKSTLLKAILNLIPIQSGSIKIHGEPLKRQQNNIAYIPQRSAVDWDFPVSALDVTCMGLYSNIGWFRRITKHHKDKALSCLEQVQMSDGANRPIGQLSGGQQQRVFMARALAQSASLYLMDEPFAGVDAKTEDIIFNILKELKNQGKTIIVVHHDLQTAATQFDDALLLNTKAIAAGKASDVLTPENLQRTYNAPILNHG